MRGLFRWSVLVLGLLLTMGCEGAEGGEGGTGGSGINTNDEFNEMLDGLGFNTDIGTPDDPYGNPLPLGYHPLGKKFTAFQPASELYMAGQVIDTVPEHIFDDSSESYAPLSFSSKMDTAWTWTETIGLRSTLAFRSSTFSTSSIKPQ
jgi:hypothetical protein